MHMSENMKWQQWPFDNGLLFKKHVNDWGIFSKFQTSLPSVICNRLLYSQWQKIYPMITLNRSHLLAIYNSMFNRTTVPSVLVTGIIIQILKKSTLDPNIVNNFRPITFGSTQGKLIEFLILPADMAHLNQFGFHKCRGTTMACNYLNDLSLYCKYKGSPLYICSLDAEKCFDSIWHEGLFYKLLDILPRSYWLFLYKWYKSMECIVRWDGSGSQPFKVCRGTRQGSILSPSLFNVFKNDLLIELSSCTADVRLDRDLCNSFAYADDITVFGLTVPDLQKLIDTCYNYSQKWRFTFGAGKTVCMISGNVSFIDNWFLGTETIQKSDSIEILGTVFSSSSSSNLHVNKRVQACRRAMYGLKSVGCCYPGLSTDVKAHLYKTIGLPSLLYGIESISLNQTLTKSLECAQSNTVKNIKGFNKRSHHSNLLHAVRIDKVETSVIRGILSLWYRIYQVDNPARILSNAMLCDYINSRHLIPGTLIHRVVEADFPHKMFITQVNNEFSWVIPDSRCCDPNWWPKSCEFRVTSFQYHLEVTEYCMESNLNYLGDPRPDAIKTISYQYNKSHCGD